MTKISENILKKIQEAQVKPEPKWKFLVKNWLIWVVFGSALFVGALSFAVILDIMVNYDWDIYTYLHQTFFQYVLFSLPYVWIGLLGLFFGIAYYDFIHLKGWYRYRVPLVFAASLFLSFGLGTIFFFAGFGENIDSSLDENVPIYKAAKVDRQQIWSHPNEGLLEGEIIKIEGGDEFVLRDSSGKMWDIQDRDKNEDDRNFVEGERVRIIGDRETDNKFMAKNIRENKHEKNRKKELAGKKHSEEREQEETQEHEASEEKESK